MTVERLRDLTESLLIRSEAALTLDTCVGIANADARTALEDAVLHEEPAIRKAAAWALGRGEHREARARALTR